MRRWSGRRIFRSTLPPYWTFCPDFSASSVVIRAWTENICWLRRNSPIFCSAETASGSTAGGGAAALPRADETTPSVEISAAAATAPVMRTVLMKTSELVWNMTTAGLESL